MKTKIKQFEFPIVVAAISQIYFCEAFALIVLNSRWIVSFKVDYFLYRYRILIVSLYIYIYIYSIYLWNFFNFQGTGALGMSSPDPE